MKAIRKSDGKVIEVEPQRFMEQDGSMYAPSELDFNVEEAEEVTIDGWVARNKDNSLYLFKAEPWYNSPRGYWDDHLMSIGCFSIPSESFPHITFDNSPIEITLTLKPKKQ
ncbi:hypothetical protein [Paramuribaculum intestinale]|uniref:hypothetical protein n=1 Tax=Paramuribaculum intestinale TaxID=2094151 RepID=UPI0025B0B7AC|nr:hypothetical protein [Paramuribaculum intestinale]